MVLLHVRYPLAIILRGALPEVPQLLSRLSFLHPVGRAGLLQPRQGLRSGQVQRVILAAQSPNTLILQRSVWTAGRVSNNNE